MGLEDEAGSSSGGLLKKTAHRRRDLPSGPTRAARWFAKVHGITGNTARVTYVLPFQPWRSA